MSEDRKYEPTPLQRLKAQQRGQFAYSCQLVSATVLLFGVLGIFMVSSGVIEALKQQTIDSFTFQSTDLQVPTVEQLGVSCRQLLIKWGTLTSPFWILISIACLGAHFAQHRFFLASERELINEKNVNPVEGFRRLFDSSALWRLLIGILQVALISAVVYSFCRAELLPLTQLARLPLTQAAGQMGILLRSLFFRLLILLFAIGAVDYLWQYWKFERSIRMTEQEMRDQMKDNN